LDHIKYPYMFPKLGIDASQQDFLLDHNRCILCTRCVRACRELVGVETLGPVNRGYSTVISADLDQPLRGSSCVSCGTCVQSCPTGALVDKYSAFGGRRSQSSSTATVCPGCNLGCPVNVVVRGNRVLRVDADFTSPMNRGVLCELGRFAPVRAPSAKRHTEVLLRKNDKLEASTLDEALEIVARELRSRQQSIVGVISPRATNEAAYLFQKLFKNNLKGGKTAIVGEGGEAEMPAPRFLGASVADVEGADFILVVGADLSRTHQVAGYAVRRALRKGAKLAMITNEGNEFCEWSDYCLVPARREYGVVVNGLMQAIVAAGYGKAATSAAFKEGLQRYSPEVVKQRTGVCDEDLKMIAKNYASATAPVIIFAGDDSLETAILSLAALAGRYDGSKASVLRVGEGVNSRGAREMARAIGAPQASVTSGSSAAYILLSDDMAVNDETLGIAKGAQFLVVQSAYATELDRYAHVILPSPTWAEKEGSFTSADGRVQRVVRAAVAPDGVSDDWAVLGALVAKLDGQAIYASTEDVLAEIVKVVPSYNGAKSAPSGTFTPACVGF
jgi:formate dehydrogenase major subunit